jgi:hypothetical protein
MSKKEKLLKKIWNKWKEIAFKIGRFNAIIILGLFYFIVLIFAAIPFKLSSDTFKLKSKNKSMWNEAKIKSDMESISRQY